MMDFANAVIIRDIRIRKSPLKKEYIKRLLRLYGKQISVYFEEYTTKGHIMGLPRYNKLTKDEFDRIMNDRNCTLSHKMIIEGRIRRGEWVIVDEDGNVDEETQEKIRNVEKNMREARKREAEKNGTDMNTNLRAAKEELKIPEDDDCEIF